MALPVIIFWHVGRMYQSKVDSSKIEGAVGTVWIRQLVESIGLDEELKGKPYCELYTSSGV